MDVRSLGWRTDLMIRRLAGARIEHCDDHVVVRSPANPEFHWGNFLLLSHPPAAADGGRVRSLWEAEFAGVPHVAVGLDGTDGTVGHPATASLLGARPELGAVLTLDRVPRARPPAPDLGSAVELRPVDVDDAAEWEQLMTLRLVSVDGPDQTESYLRHRHSEAESMVRTASGAWWGAFVDGVIRAELGIFTDGGGLARYQFVGTHPAYRRRGLTSALVAAAGEWALGALTGVRRLVIIADADGDALAIYRRLGFTHVEWTAQLYRPPSLRGA